jgi:hypothetical protein
LIGRQLLVGQLLLGEVLRHALQACVERGSQAAADMAGHGGDLSSTGCPSRRTRSPIVHKDPLDRGE